MRTRDLLNFKELELNNLEFKHLRFSRGLFIINKARLIKNEPKSYKRIGFGRRAQEKSLFENGSAFVYKNKRNQIIVVVFLPEFKDPVYLTGYFKILTPIEKHSFYYDGVRRAVINYMLSFWDEIKDLPNKELMARLKNSKYVTDYFYSKIDAAQMIIENPGVLQDAVRKYNVDMNKYYCNWLYLDRIARSHMLDFIKLNELKQECVLIKYSSKDLYKYRASEFLKKF